MISGGVWCVCVCLCVCRGCCRVTLCNSNFVDTLVDSQEVLLLFLVLGLLFMVSSSSWSLSQSL